ncbi:hypothetical protein [Streptomyces sp. RFCAC02]|uniref:hypothetical protein n=1 Tax=Streptomyces sp. RFCAC02 TaxID=2499143 RepID=UPI00101F7064|nr:hypothetical protein [Streptomyces sp. RFCAC02]
MPDETQKLTPWSGDGSSGNIRLNYEGIADCCTVLVSQSEMMIPEIYRLVAKVDMLLDNGLYLEQASPALKTVYEQFSMSLHSAAANLQSYANTFENVKHAFEFNDLASAQAALEGLDGEGGYDLGPDPEYQPVEGETPLYSPPGGTIGSDVTWNENHDRVIDIK